MAFTPTIIGYVTDQYKETGANLLQMQAISFAFSNEQNKKDIGNVITFDNGETWLYSEEKRRYFIS